MSQSANTYDVYLSKAKQKVLQKLIVSDINNKLALSLQVRLNCVQQVIWTKYK